MSAPWNRVLDDVFSKKPFSDDVISRKTFLDDGDRLLGDVFSKKTILGWCLLQQPRFGMMAFPGSCFLDDVFFKKPFLDDVFSRKPFFFGWCLLQEVVFGKMFFGKWFLKFVWKMFGKIGAQSIQESRPKIRGPKSRWKMLGQKAKPGPSKNRFKLQNNNLKTGRRSLARRPVFGRRRLRRRVVVLKFESICCRTWLGFLAKLFSSGFWPPDFWSRFLDRLLKEFSKHVPNMSEKLFPKKHFSKKASRRKHHPKIDIAESVCPKPIFSKIGFPKAIFHLSQQNLQNLWKNSELY